MPKSKTALTSTDAIVDALMSDPARERFKFIEQVDMDRVVAAILRLTMEVSVLRDRIDTLESLAEKYGGYSLADVESYRPTPEEEQRRAERRRTLVARIVRDLT